MADSRFEYTLENSSSRHGKLVGTAETCNLDLATWKGEDCKCPGDSTRVPKGVNSRGFLMTILSKNEHVPHCPAEHLLPLMRRRHKLDCRILLSRRGRRVCLAPFLWRLHTLIFRLAVEIISIFCSTSVAAFLSCCLGLGPDTFYDTHDVFLRSMVDLLPYELTSVCCSSSIATTSADESFTVVLRASWYPSRWILGEICLSRHD
jgi:hypothetical protein